MDGRKSMIFMSGEKNMNNYNFIDLSDFLDQQKFIKFDYLLGFTKKSEEGKVLKIPAKFIRDFTNPNVKIADMEQMKKAVSEPSKVPYPLTGIILKSVEGLKIFDKQLICIDIDCKKDPEKGNILYEKVVAYLESLDYSKELITKVTEKTISGGYHIFITSTHLYPQQKLYIEQGIEIEIFSNNRYIAVAPSIGYSTFTENTCILFNECYDITLNTIDLDSFCNFFDNTEEKEKQELEFNPDFIYDEDNFKKIIKSWRELERFAEGSSDTDWNNIKEKGSTYDYIRYNIMPIYTLFDKVDEFTKIIENYGTRYLGQWKQYPDKWLEQVQENVIIMGSDARKRCYKIGIFTKKTGFKKQFLIENFVLGEMPSLFKNVLVVYDAIYYYSELYRCYIYLEKATFNNVLGLHYKNKLGVILKPEDYRSLQETFEIYAKIFCVDTNHENYIAYDLLDDRSYKQEVALVFKNGTLYLKGSVLRFKKDFFSPKDKSLFSIQENYTPNLLEENKNSVVKNWLDTKFCKKDLDFIKLFFGNLLVPNYTPSIMLVLYSYKGGLGKSTLAKTLGSLFDVGSSSMITTMPLTKLDERFGGGNLSRALLNITTELEGQIDSEAFKNVISREKRLTENKFEDAKFEIPLAKHISMSNDVPRISTDGGVTRRLGVFELSEKKAMPHIEAHMYETMFLDDKSSLLGFMLQGLVELQKIGFADLSNYYRVNFKENIRLLQEYNSNVFEWLGMEGDKIIEIATKDGGLSENDMYNLYRTWCAGNECKPLKKRTVVKYLLSMENMTKKRDSSGIKIVKQGV